MALSIASSRFAQREKSVRTRSKRSSGVAPAISDAAAIAPALIIALRGRPVFGRRLIS